MASSTPLPRRAASAGPFVLTRGMIHAAAMDAAKANMRRSGRAVLDDEDADVFIATFDRLFLAVGGPDGYHALAPDPS